MTPQLVVCEPTAGFGVSQITALQTIGYDCRHLDTIADTWLLDGDCRAKPKDPDHGIKKVGHPARLKGILYSIDVR